jgi:hypothetical protein
MFAKWLTYELLLCMQVSDKRKLGGRLVLTFTL